MPSWLHSYQEQTASRRKWNTCCMLHRMLCNIATGYNVFLEWDVIYQLNALRLWYCSFLVWLSPLLVGRNQPLVFVLTLIIRKILHPRWLDCWFDTTLNIGTLEVSVFITLGELADLKKKMKFQNWHVYQPGSSLKGTLWIAILVLLLIGQVNFCLFLFAYAECIVTIVFILRYDKA